MKVTRIISVVLSLVLVIGVVTISVAASKDSEGSVKTGTYANDKVAVSCTGHGEYFIRWAVAHDIAALYAYKNLPIEDAAKQALEKIKEAGGTGGVIAIDFQGNVAMPFNTKGMVRGSVSSEQEPEVSAY